MCVDIRQVKTNDISIERRINISAKESQELTSVRRVLYFVCYIEEELSLRDQHAQQLTFGGPFISYRKTFGEHTVCRCSVSLVPWSCDRSSRSITVHHQEPYSVISKEFKLRIHKRKWCGRAATTPPPAPPPQSPPRTAVSTSLNVPGTYEIDLDWIPKSGDEGGSRIIIVMCVYDLGFKFCDRSDRIDNSE